MCLLRLSALVRILPKRICRVVTALCLDHQRDTEIRRGQRNEQSIGSDSRLGGTGATGKLPGVPDGKADSSE